MGPPGTSRKGKKAWRKNIDAADVEEHIRESSHQERRGPAVETLPDQQLFFIDTGADAAAASAAAAGAERRTKREMRPLRSQLILEAAKNSIKPVVAYAHPKRKDGGLRQRGSAAAGKQTAVAAGAGRGKQAQPAAAGFDLWADDSAAADPSLAPSTSAPSAAVAPAGAAAVAEERPLDLALMGKVKGVGRGKKSRAARVLTPNAPQIKAVEIDQAGCSYNPDKEAHQEALAVLVSSEMKKLLKKELKPAPPPMTVEVAPGQMLDELAQLQVEADEDENEIDIDGEDDAAADAAAKRRAAAAKKTKKDRNKEKRRAESEAALAAQRELKRQRRDMGELKSIEARLEEEKEEKELRRQRREVVKAEKAACQPPRLGKYKYEEPPVRVLTSDEVTGSLRTLKAFPMLTGDRFKSLQKRGLIEPRKQVTHKLGKKVVYEKGARLEKALAGQEEIKELQRQNKLLAKSVG